MDARGGTLAEARLKGDGRVNGGRDERK